MCWKTPFRGVYGIVRDLLITAEVTVIIVNSGTFGGLYTSEINGN